MKKNSEVILIIPSYNEAGNIERVVDELVSGYPQFDYVVVTDGPTDGTDEICRRRGYNTVFLPENMGLTLCFRNGMRYAWENGYAYAVQFDGDGQHRPEYISSMVDAAKKGAELVQGSRFLPLPGETGSRNPLRGMRAFGSGLIRFWIRIRTGIRVTDPTCGLRLYGRELIGDFANRSGYAPEPDTVAALLERNVAYAEVPVRVEERKSGESYLRPGKAVRYMWRMMRSILWSPRRNAADKDENER